jgi:hypothetical protein
MLVEEVQIMSVINLNLPSNDDRGIELSIKRAPEVQTEESMSYGYQSIRMLQEAANVEAQNNGGWIPSQWAAGNGHLAIFD